MRTQRQIARARMLGGGPQYGLDLQLNSGRVIHLHELSQHPTYSGLLEGEPWASLNQELIESALQYARGKLWNAGIPHLIEPLIRVRPGFSKPSLPPAVCLAHFESSQAARNPGAGMSFLSFVWFQDQFAFPIDPMVLAQIKDVDWENLARDCEI